ncbi:MAG: FAD-dependent oxidoreductase, partial [Nitrospinota bacterium]
MKPEHFLVIGNGPAGFNAALTLRKKAPKSQITILSKEIESHYSPHLLPGFISGKIEENAIYPFPFSIYRENKIKLRNRQEAIALNISRRELTLAHNETISFDGLIIAAGGKPRIIEPLLRFKNFMLTLKTVQNAKHWVQTLKEVDSVFITGGDLTSLAFSKALVEMNKKVFFLLNKEALWPLRHTPTLFYEIKEALTQRGVHVIDGPGVTTISKVSKNVFGITTGNTTVKAGTVGAFFGLTPDIRFLAESGLNIDR